MANSIKTPAWDFSISNEKETGRFLFWLARCYALSLLIVCSLLPFFGTAYLYLFQDQALFFKDFHFHELAIASAIMAGGFVTFVTWKSYQSSGEPLLRWITLGLLGFTLVYAPHGFFTRFADSNLWLFLLYGPVSRVFMAGCFLLAMLRHGKPVDPVKSRVRINYWAGWVAGFLLLDLLIFVFSQYPLAKNLTLRISLEGVGAGLGISTIMVAISIGFFAQSSMAFTLGSPWNHLWWFAHAIFASGFLLLSYGVVQAFRTTQSFVTVYSQTELMDQLRKANQTLERLASIDPLTGVNNRREFMVKTRIELSRARRSKTKISILSLDLDHFKEGSSWK
jgi:hypothetical protein